MLLHFFLPVITLVFFILPFSANAFEAPESHHYTLKNGLELYVIPNTIAPAITHMVWYKIGAADEPPGKSGIAHFLEHLMFKRSKNLASGEFSEIIARHGGNENAATSYDFTTYYQTIAKEHLPLVMQLEAERMQHLTFDEKEVATEKDVVMEERRMRIDNNPIAQLSETMLKTLFAGHPYHIPVIGWPEEIRSYTAQDAKQFYQRYYAPNHAIVVVTGDVTPEDALAFAKQYYGPIPANATPPARLATFTLTPKTTTLTHRNENVIQPEWLRYYAAPSHHTAEDKNAIYALNVLATILGDGETSRLYQSLVMDQHIATSVSVNYDDITRGPSMFTLYAMPAQNIPLEKIEAAIETEINHIMENPVTNDELEKAKFRLKSQIIFAQDGLRRLAFTYGTILTAHLGVEYMNHWEENIEQVTAENVQKAARLLFTRPRSVTGHLKPKEAKNAL